MEYLLKIQLTTAQYIHISNLNGTTPQKFNSRQPNTSTFQLKSTQYLQNSTPDGQILPHFKITQHLHILLQESKYLHISTQNGAILFLQNSTHDGLIPPQFKITQYLQNLVQDGPKPPHFNSK